MSRRYRWWCRYPECGAYGHADTSHGARDDSIAHHEQTHPHHPGQENTP